MRFTLAGACADVAFVVAGTGAAPLLQALGATLAAHGPSAAGGLPTFHAVWEVRARCEAFCADRLAPWVASGRLRLHYAVTGRPQRFAGGGGGGGAGAKRSRRSPYGLGGKVVAAATTATRSADGEEDEEGEDAGGGVAAGAEVWAGKISAERLRVALGPLLAAARAEAGAAIAPCFVSGPPPFCEAAARLLLEELQLPRNALCRLD